MISDIVQYAPQPLHSPINIMNKHMHSNKAQGRRMYMQHNGSESLEEQNVPPMGNYLKCTEGKGQRISESSTGEPTQSRRNNKAECREGGGKHYRQYGHIAGIFHRLRVSLK